MAASARGLQRFKRFRDAVEADFASVHQVRDYARRLGYSDKSLTRSTLELAGVSAKTLVSQRIALEAQRLLAGAHLEDRVGNCRAARHGRADHLRQVL